MGFPAILLIDKSIRQDYKKFMSIWAETFALTYGLTNITKVLVSRERPYLYGMGEGSADMEHKLEDDNQRSFFSGHTSMSAASWVMMASMYQDYHPQSKLAPLSGLRPICCRRPQGIFAMMPGNIFLLIY